MDLVDIIPLHIAVSFSKEGSKDYTFYHIKRMNSSKYQCKVFQFAINDFFLGVANWVVRNIF